MLKKLRALVAAGPGRNQPKPRRFVPGVCSRSRTPVRRAVVSVEQFDQRLLLTTGPFQTPPPEGVFISSGGSGHFAYLRASDASGDDTPATVFRGGALRVSYSIVLDPSAASPGSVFLAPIGGDDPLPPPPPPPPPLLPSPLDHVTVE